MGGSCRYCGNCSVNRLTPIVIMDGLLRDERAFFPKEFWLRWFINCGVLLMLVFDAKWLLALFPLPAAAACLERVNVQAKRANLLKLVITDWPSKGSLKCDKLILRQNVIKLLLKSINADF